jgi:RHS repeat-associated protein
MCLLSCITASRAIAYTQWEWKIDGSSTVYQKKADAVAAMHSAAPQNSVLTKELLQRLDSSQAVYKYVAPPTSPSYTPWMYSGSGCPGSTFCYTSEADAVNSILQVDRDLRCGPGSGSPAGDWMILGAGYDVSESRSYNFTWPTWNANTQACDGTSHQFTQISRTRAASCPQYYSLSGIAPYCLDNNVALVYGHPVQPCNCDAPDNSTYVNNPVDVATADKFQTETDFSSPTLSFTRYYHSASLETSHGLGVGWTHNFAALLVLSSATPLGLERPDGHQEPLSLVSGQYVSQSGSGIHVQASGSNWIAFQGDGTQEVYSNNGVLIKLITPAGQISTLNYNPDGTLGSVVDPFGHSLQFSYTGGLLTQVTDPAGRTIGYGYDANVNLSSVTYQDGTTRIYAYENASLPNHLTGITDENSTRYATYGYDPIGRATSSQHAGGADAVSVTYGTNAATVTDGIGGTTVFTFTSLSSYSNRPIAISHNGLSRGYVVPAPGIDVQRRTTQMTDANGHITNYAYDANHLTSKTEAAGTPSQRTTSYQYLATNTALPTLVTEPLKKTAYAYYSGTNLVQTKTVTDTTVTPNVSRTWSYTYDSYGRVLTMDGPRTDVPDVTTYTYYTCATGYQCGHVQTVTNAAGQTTTYNTYNAYGQPLTLTDPNGLVTTLTYDLRQHLTSRQVGTETTTFDYWPTGLLKKVTLPDSSYLLYSYDGAHRLTQVSDGLGNAIDYTLDAMGNRTAENLYDPSNVLHRTHTRVFNTLNQLYQDVNAAGTAAVTTTFGYDNYGNQTSLAAPLARNTGNAYDELNRLKQITDPASGITKFGYDANDDLTSVTDPRNRMTSYGYNGFGDVVSLVSPDTGTTANTYDSGGNLGTSTDARGAVATYGYDPLNRVSSVAYSLGGTTDQAITFTYDSGTNGKGHLTGASDANHSLSWSYDPLGRVTNKTQTAGGVSLSAGYGYTSGNLTSLTTPSGQTVTYGYNADHQVTTVSVNGTPVLSAITYEPLGPVNGWTWGNGATTTRTYDTDGKITQIASNGTKTYSYDDAFRISGITDTSSGSTNWTYGYDLLDRLTSGTSASITRGWGYDANGNRLTETGSSPSTYTISPTNNRISAISGSLARSYGYDSAGNTTSYGSVTATYNNAGRLKTLAQGGSTETLIYNALGQRIEKSGGSAGTVVYAYDEAGHLLGEYDGSGTLIEETVWLGDIPVATLQPNGSAISIYYVHTDQLNTPRQITRPSDNAQMWTWFSDPFGTDPANANPVGLGAFTYNLRFPGQVFDGQAGLHQNYFRDYDPATGRYPESDPMGLAGGSYSTYVYGNGNPLSRTDPTGRNAVAIPVGVGIAVGVAACYLIPNCWQGLEQAIDGLLHPPAASPFPVSPSGARATEHSESERKAAEDECHDECEHLLCGGDGSSYRLCRNTCMKRKGFDTGLGPTIVPGR